MAVIAFNAKALKTFLKAHTTHQAFYNRMMTGLKSMVAALMNISSSLIHQADTEMSHNALSGVAGIGDFVSIPIASGAVSMGAKCGRVLLRKQEQAHLRECVVSIQAWESSNGYLLHEHFATEMVRIFEVQLAQTDAAGAKALAESLVTKITQATLHGYEPTEEEDIYECWFRAALHASAEVPASEEMDVCAKVSEAFGESCMMLRDCLLKAFAAVSLESLSGVAYMEMAGGQRWLVVVRGV